MATWITIAADDLQDYLLAPQLAALRSAALGASQSDPLPGIINDAADHVRGKIASNPANSLSATAYAVPATLKTHVCYIAIFRAQLRIPQLKMTDDQKLAYRNALDDLNRIADGKDAVEQPDDAVSSNTAAISPAYSNPNRRFSHEEQNGI